MSDPPPSDPARLELTAEAMRRLGYRVVDRVVERLVGLSAAPAARRSTRAELEARLDGGFPDAGVDPEAGFEAALGTVFDTVLGSAMPVDHPRFFGFVPSPGNYVGALADFVVAGANPFVGTWFAGSGPAALELRTVDWLRRLCGLPDGAGGLFVSGGSAANLTALAVARHRMLGDRLDGAVAYLSDQTHSSLARALRVIGVPPAGIRKLASDADLRLAPAAVAAAVAADRAAGRRPFVVVATAGTTNTGAVDPLGELADLCAREGLWLHVDGAYGAPARLVERGRRLLADLGRADSLSLDPHKWLFQPFACGCVLLRERALLAETFAIRPEYLRDIDHDPLGEVHFADRGIELTRPFRALKLWLSLQVFGVAAFRAAVDRGIDLAEAAERRLRASANWEVTTRAQLAIVSFRRRGLSGERADALHTAVVEGMVADGGALLTSTVIGGRTVLRLCAINPRTTEADLDRTLALADAVAAGYSGNS